MKSEYHIDIKINHLQTTIKYLALLSEDCIIKTTYTLCNDIIISVPILILKIEIIYLLIVDTCLTLCCLKIVKDHSQSDGGDAPAFSKWLHCYIVISLTSCKQLQSI
jgi:hypothetical protein